MTEKLELKRIIKADRNRVFHAWTMPVFLKSWIAPGPLDSKSVEVDLKVGGSYRIEMTGEMDGKPIHGHVGGKYLKIIPGEMLQFTWYWQDSAQSAPPEETLVSVEFKSLKDGTELTLTHEKIDSLDDREDIEGGWMGSLEKLEGFVSGPKKDAQVTRHFNVPAEKVFDAWLDPKTASKWLFATPKGQMVRTEVDARVGGKFIFVDRRDGVDVEHVGEYIEINRPHRLVFTFGVPKFSAEFSRVAIEITSRGSGCELTLTHFGILPEYTELTRQGWGTLLTGLENSL